ncbi:SusC/RagA family TonB-linked outer membrane protein [Sunxiuqinia indica]|uniref:SusC/RagA family TonB-linked outer membrane protein n=1 Tax=Sunxiuqinia indica TaxID=2692584 RepID=UPI00135AB4C0|nr:SusC/RagA family TonB-linked outer membrane protein [Sunxiuqinia indica]
MKKKRSNRGLQPLYYQIIRKMKLTIFLLCISLLGAFANEGYSQDTKLTVVMNNSSIEDVLGNIENQSKFRFFYNEKIDVDKKVSVDFLNENIFEILDNLFKGTNLKYEVLGRQIVLSENRLETQQTKIAVTGKVLDSLGLPLPGVTVILKGTTNGTITNTDGQYSVLDVPANSILVFSFVGMKTQEIPVDGKTSIDVIMTEDAIGLEEVIAIGYGTVKKKDLTGSIGSVASEQIATRGSTEALEALQGQLAGVNISRSSGRADVGFNIVIRGQNSISGGSPLYVVDGSIVDNIDFLNPNDITQMDVLKDASSTAIYGSRGSNGVVLITTKGAGVENEKISISYKGYYGIKTPAHTAPMMNAEQWLNYRIAAAQGNSLDPFSGDVFGDSDENRYVSSDEWDREIERRIAAGETYNWEKNFLENGYRQNHYLSLNGKSGNTSYSLTAGYQKEKGFIEKDFMDKYTFSIDLKHKFNEKWEAGGLIRTGLKETEVGGGKSIMNLYRMPPIFLANDPTGWLYEVDGLTISPATIVTGSMNPILDQRYSNSNGRSIDLLGKVFFNYRPYKWLSARTEFLPRFKWIREASWGGQYSESAGGLQENTTASILNRNRINFTWDNQVNTKKSFGDHTIQGTVLFSVYDFQQEDYRAEVKDLPQNTSFYNMGIASERTSTESSYTMNRLTSFMGRLNYDYANKYLLTLSARWDGSSKLAEGHKWAAFPSTAVAWRVEQEPFMQNIPVVSMLKARLSYGFTGNNNINAFQSSISANSLYYYDFGGIVSNGIGPSGIANNALTWERTEEVDFGLDFGLFKGRVSGTVDLYTKLSKDLLMKRKLPVPMGWDEMTDNIGSVRNKGIEVSLRTINIQTQNIKWETSFVFSTNKNEIVETNLGKVDDVVNGLFIGQPVDVYYNYDMIGVWQLDEVEEAAKWGRVPGEIKIRDISGPEGVPDGKIEAQYDRTVIGKPIPDWTGSLYTQLMYKNFDFSMSVYTEQGITKKSRFFNDLIYTNRNTVVHNYWTITNPSNDAPSPKYATNDDFWGRKGAQLQNYKDCSYTRVQNITFGYTFSKQFVQRVNMSRLRIYANVTNPILITDFQGHDPEFGDKGTNDGPGFMTVQFGVNVNF